MKNFNSKIIIYTVAILSAVAILVLTQLGDEEEIAPKSKEKFSSDNPQYKKLNDNIINYANSKKWNRYTYKSIDNDIERYHSDKKINDKENEALLESLVLKHILLLKDSLRNFCRFAYTHKNNRRKQIGELKKEVADFKNNKAKVSMKDAKTLIRSYGVIAACLGNSHTYYSTSEYISGKSKNYTDILNKYMGEKYFREDSVLQVKITQRIASINKLGEIDVDFKNGKMSEIDCDCEKFKGFKFYYDTCQAIKNMTLQETSN